MASCVQGADTTHLDDNPVGFGAKAGALKRASCQWYERTRGRMVDAHIEVQ